MTNKTVNFILKYIHWLLLILIIYLAIFLRLTTAGSDVLLDFDPWFFFRQAKMLVDNNLFPLRWDLLSYFPPGRPVDYQLGWPYTLAISYLIGKMFIPSLTLMKSSAIFIAIFAGLSAIPAYLFGRLVTNRWGGLITAFFATITPTYLSVSMAGYPDSDAVVVFYTFLVAFSILYAIQKKSKLGIVLGIASLWLFAFNWNSSWYIYYIFLFFIPFLLFFEIVEAIISRKERIAFTQLVRSKIKEHKSTFLIIIIIGIVSAGLTFATKNWPFNTISPIDQLIAGLNIIRGQSLIVNISVAELQPVNVFTRDGFLQIANRIGMFPIILSFLTFAFIFLKLARKIKVGFAEYFIIVWLIISLWLITRGIRFSLIFSLAVAAASGYVVGNTPSILEIFKLRGRMLVSSTVYGFILFLLLLHFSDNLNFSINAGGLDIGQNWKDALKWLQENANRKAIIATWWDPGHIITGFTGLRVHADGAHCPAHDCVPYFHNDRIQDMGKVFTTNNETEAVNILRKYMQLTQEQCQQVKEKFGNIVPKEGCEAASEMYFIASADLIGKYYWLSCFGQYRGANCQGNSFLQLPLSGRDLQQNLVYGNIVTLTAREDRVIAIINVPQQGVRNAIVRNLVYFDGGQMITADYSNTTNTIDGMVWVDPSFQNVIFMQADIRDSLFTKMFFFDGQGLNKFEMVFNNGEVKIYKVNFD